MESSRVAAAFTAACLTELNALKPGNVHRHGPGHGMTVADFEASARAAGPIMALPGLNVGERILGAIERTHAAVACNTNLGIVLLCAPLAQAALHGRGADLRRRLGVVLDALDVADAQRAFAAIRLAEPAGLGTSPAHDVHAPATVDLRVAMAEAGGRDRIALQYATGFADIFEFGLPRLRTTRDRWRDETWSASSVYLGFLARFPDTHLVRKFGTETAEKVRAAAASLDERLLQCTDPAALFDLLLDHDRALKAKGLNPGSSADLTVVTLFADALQQALAGSSAE